MIVNLVSYSVNSAQYEEITYIWVDIYSSLECIERKPSTYPKFERPNGKIPKSKIFYLCQELVPPAHGGLERVNLQKKMPGSDNYIFDMYIPLGIKTRPNENIPSMS